jgi:hypothetical protein
LTIDPRDDDLLYLAARVDGVQVSRNGCETWGPSNNGLGSAFVNSIVVDPQSNVYAATPYGIFQLEVR